MNYDLQINLLPESREELEESLKGWRYSLE